MFVQDQSGKVLFNMKYYKINRNKNTLFVFDKEGNKLGILGQYNTEEMAQEVFESIRSNIQYASMNKIYCICQLPENNYSKELVK